MDTVIDFSSCQRIHESYGGTDRKFGVIYNGDKYMLKFAEAHAKKHDISTSYVNNVLAEYISSHITRAIGMPAHETVIGVYKGTLVVGCKDFRENDNVRNIEFSEYVRSTYDSKDVKRIIKLNQIYETLKDRDNAIPEELQEATIQRYWDTFVIDALVGNFDRHIGNWGYLAENNHLKLAPIYDFGSTLFPNMSDEGARTFLGNQHEMLERCLVFPSPALAITDEKVGKVGYYDMLASNYDENCTAALLRIAPKIDMNKIRDVVDNTPLISPVRKQFYKEILQMRKELIIDRAFLQCFYKEYDRESLNRLHQGHQFSESDLKCFIFERNAHEQDFVQNEELLTEAFKNPFHSAQEIADLVTEQKRFMELYGFHSNHVWDNVCTDYREQNFQTENQHNRIDSIMMIHRNKQTCPSRTVISPAGHKPS